MLYNGVILQQNVTFFFFFFFLFFSDLELRVAMKGGQRNVAFFLELKLSSALGNFLWGCFSFRDAVF